MYFCGFFRTVAFTRKKKILQGQFDTYSDNFPHLIHPILTKFPELIGKFLCLSLELFYANVWPIFENITSAKLNQWRSIVKARLYNV